MALRGWNYHRHHGAYGYEQAESAYAPYDRLADDDPDTREALARVIRGTVQGGQPAFVAISNKAEGSAPLSVFALAEAVRSSSRRPQYRPPYRDASKPMSAVKLKLPIKTHSTNTSTSLRVVPQPARMTKAARGEAVRDNGRLQAMHESSVAAGAACLENEWLGAKHHYHFRCSHGHEWVRKNSAQRKNPHCPLCKRGALGLARLLWEAPGVTCLDTELSVVGKHRYRFRCSQGHEWARRADGVRVSVACPLCTRRIKGQAGSFTAMLQVSEAAGVTCLDTEWRGVLHRYRFRCAAGHEWTRLGQSQQVHPRCRVCLANAWGASQRKPENLLRLQEMALARGGVCLSTEYGLARDKYHFRCAAGHEWKTTVSVILAGCWCKRCDADKKRTTMRLQDGLARLKQHAQARGGECLAGEYLGTLAHYPFRCAKGHEWESAGKKAFRGSWCQQCAFDAKRLSIDHAHEAAAARGGRCLSAQYVNSTLKLRWLCDQGHEWQAPLVSIRQGHWCKRCDVISRITNGNSKARWRNGNSGKG